MNNKHPNYNLTIEGKRFVRPDTTRLSSNKGDLLWVSYDSPRLELWKRFSKWTVVGPDLTVQGKQGQGMKSVLALYHRHARNLEIMQRDKATGTITLAEPLPKNAVAVVTYEHEWTMD